MIMLIMKDGIKFDSYVKFIIEAYERANGNFRLAW